MPSHQNRNATTTNNRPDNADSHDASGNRRPAPQPPSAPGGGALANSLFSGDHVLETVMKGGALLRPGARGPAVRAIQQFLFGAGYDLGRWGADGAWGKVTTQAIKDWQGANGLSADGVIGPATLGAMDKAGGGDGPGQPDTPTPEPEPEPVTPAPAPDPEPTQPEPDAPAPDTTPTEITIPTTVTNLNMREFSSALDPVLGGATLGPNSARVPHVYGVQRALSAMGYDTNGIDGKYGGGTTGAVSKLQRDKNLLGAGEQAGTVQARTLAFLDQNAPMHAQVLKKTQINYDKLYADKLVEFGLFVGYDENIGGHWYQDVTYAHGELESLGFVQDKAAAAKAYEEAGRPMDDGVGEWWVHEAFTSHLGKNIKAVFRLAHADMGPDVAKEHREALMHSEVTMYSGHGRYGSGPDFDKNYTITVEGERMSYDELKHYLGEKLGTDHPTGAQKKALLMKLHAQGVIKVEGHNTGNVVMNDKDVQGGFGSALMYLALENNKSDGESSRKRMTADYQAEATDNYKVWMFDGCSTSNYMSSIRRDVSKDDVAVMGTGESITMCTSIEMVRGMMQRATGAEIAAAMSKSHKDRSHDGKTGEHFVDG